MIQLLQAIPGISINNPEGAFMHFPKLMHCLKKLQRMVNKLQTLLSSVKSCWKRLMWHVSLIRFGSEGYMRLSYATDDLIDEGLNRLALG